MIKSYIKEGKIVPMEVTIKLLENAMRDKMEGSNSSSSQGQGRGGRRFLIDGFPRQMDQAVKFDESVCFFLSFSRKFEKVLDFPDEKRGNE